MDNFKSNSQKNKIEKEWADLNKELDKHNYLYHGLDQPEISDAQYDKIKARLDSLEREYTFINSKKSALNNVGFHPSSNFNKIRHKLPMLSLNNAFNENDVLELSLIHI